MPRNMSFSLTTDQVRNRTKTVTRRKGWKFLKAGTVLNACVKCMGLKPGEKIEHICQIRVIDVREESLSKMKTFPEYGETEAEKQGFPELTGAGFVAMFIHHMNCPECQSVTRIEFEYL